MPVPGRALTSLHSHRNLAPSIGQVETKDRMASAAERASGQDEGAAVYPVLRFREPAVVRIRRRAKRGMAFVRGPSRSQALEPIPLDPSRTGRVQRGI
jgi:hypothetical protein